MWRMTRKFEFPITHEVFNRIQQNPKLMPEWLKIEIGNLAKEYSYFHWHIEYPDVFDVPEMNKLTRNHETTVTEGFDCVIGNPPWERISSC